MNTSAERATNTDHARRTKKLLVPVRFFVTAVIEPVSSSYHLNELRGAVHGTSLLFGIVPTFFGNRDDSNQSQTTRLFSDIFRIIFFFQASSFIGKKFETPVNVM